ncbi:hypothetical protein FDG2_1973 [Candidatus Protofrankia californiensis]|uniref:Uncharacterized protein n=1 Tax=Candidatus Protofrankia californiensis TaxID=1839754 RepID=A0A1C3NWS4_9ACTN|nr:hypothetical protein FDG2_1973 [Candidatus Protofrankia californiensis]
MHLVLIEMSGNQPFIFGTNKQRENIGASELTTMISKWADDAIETIHQTPDQTAPTVAKQVVRVVTASGKVVLLVTETDTARSEQIAHTLVTEVTSQAVQYAPGLAVDGAFVLVTHDDLATDRGQRELLRRVHAAARPAAAARFPQVPFAAICRYSGLPATVPLPAVAPRSTQTLDDVQAAARGHGVAADRGVSHRRGWRGPAARRRCRPGADLEVRVRRPGQRRPGRHRTGEGG